MQCEQEQSTELSRDSIIQELIESGLVEKCVMYQTRGCKNPFWVEELTQNCWEWLLTYDEHKLIDAAKGRHLNALITRYLQNQYCSKTSSFYRTYKRTEIINEEIKGQILNIPDGQY